MAKLVDRESLKAFRQANDERYAKPNGNYPTLTSGLADNFTPYSEDSGASQENPFISNGTGTNNNTEIVTVGDYGLLEEKQANTLVVNQRMNIANLTFANLTKTTITGGYLYTCNANTSASNVYSLQTPKFTSNHKILLILDVKSSKTSFTISDFGSSYKYYSLTANQRTIIYDIQSALGNYNYIFPLGVTGDVAVDDTIEIYKILFIDLTKMFNGNIPQDLLDHPEHFSWYYNGSLAYNTGTLVNANGVKLVSTGRNLWDEEYIAGGEIQSDGSISTGYSNRFASKNYIPIIPNTDVYFRLPYSISSYGVKVAWYDKNKNRISVGNKYSNIQASPNNACFMRFSVNASYGSTTYNHDITISLYYTPEQGGEGYGKYYPYKEPYVVDTGNEVLRKAGSVKDVKVPSGAITRNVGYVDLSTLVFTYIEVAGYHSYFRASISDLKNASSQSDIANILCNKYVTTTHNQLVYGSGDKVIAVNTNGNYIEIYDSSLPSNTTTIDGTLYYELATPTTEQGTPFAENLPINDYGMLYWLDENDNLVGIPQGAKIFYPTNYKGFVDDMYSRVDGDSSKYVIDTELSAVDTKHDSLYAIMQENIGGALRHQLATMNSVSFNKTAIVDLSSLTWSYNSTFQIFNANVSSLGLNVDNTKVNGICARYNTVKGTEFSASPDKTMSVGTTYISSTLGIVVKDSSFNGDATAFKNSLKGILLAYEKA